MGCADSPSRSSSRNIAYSTLPMPAEKLLGSKLGMEAMHITSPVSQSSITTVPAASATRQLPALPLASEVLVVGGGLTGTELVFELAERYPHLRWVLLGDSGQADAELYAEAAQTFGERIAAIYIRDVDPLLDSPRDRAVQAHIERVAGTSVPMLRAPDSLAMAEHAAGLGLIDPARLADIAAEVERDEARPGQGEAAVEEALQRGAT